MANKVAFYILNSDATPKGRALYTCRIIEKAFNNKHKIYIYTTDPEETKSFDTQLWTFGDISFVPHEIYTSESDPSTQILISDTAPPPEHTDIMVNLTQDIPTEHKQFKHIIEVIPNDDKQKALGRKRFKAYQKNGYQAEAFNID